MIFFISAKDKSGRRKDGGKTKQKKNEHSKSKKVKSR